MALLSSAVVLWAYQGHMRGPGPYGISTPTIAVEEETTIISTTSFTAGTSTRSNEIGRRSISTTASTVAAAAAISSKARVKKSMPKKLPRSPQTQLQPHRIAVITMYAGTSRPLESVTGTNKAAYCAKHGYAYHNAAREPMLQGLVQLGETGVEKLHFVKVKALLYYLGTNKYDWVLWSDADAVFLNHSKTLSALLPHNTVMYSSSDGVRKGSSSPPLQKRLTNQSPLTNVNNMNAVVSSLPVTPIDFIFTAGPPHSLRWRGVINSGHFFLRASTSAISYLRAVWARRKRPCKLSSSPPLPSSDSGGKYNFNNNGNHGNNNDDNDRRHKLYNGWLDLCGWEGEQGALMEVLESAPRWQRAAQYVPFRSFNSFFPFWGEGDLVVHFPGRPEAERTQLLRALIQAADTATGQLRNGIPQALRPVYSPDHLRDMDYRALNNGRAK
eukprot:UC1_evm1s2181